MKALLYTLAISLVFASCDFGDGEPVNNNPIVTEEADTTIPTKVDNTEVSEPDEIPVAALPTTATKQAIQSMDLVVTTTPGMKVEDLETFLLVCNDEVVKDAKCFTMSPFIGKLKTEGLQYVKLKGRQFHYSETVDGKMKKLTGYINIGTKWYKVEAEDVNPAWIFPYLAVMEPKAAI